MERPIGLIKRQTGHKSDRVLAGYIHEGEAWRDNVLHFIDAEF
jgi:hypothetical protein